MDRPILTPKLATPLAADRARYRRWVIGLGGLVLGTATAVVILGSGLNVAVVRSFIPGAVGMKFLTAVGLGAGASALLLLADHRPGRRRKLGVVLATVPGVLCLAVLAGYGLHVNLGIGQFPSAHQTGPLARVAFPGRPAPTTGVCFLLLTGSLLLLDRGTRWRWRPSELLAIPILLIAFISLIGYAYSIPAFYGPASAEKMAFNTSLCFLALGGALLIARPRGRILELATTTDPGGVMVRRMVPFCAIVPLGLGWLYLRAVGWGLFNDHVGTWWLAAATIALLVAMMWICAGTLSRSDHDRRALEDQLYELANHDTLTGLINRHRFDHELDQLVKRSARYRHNGSLLIIDLDRLKPINDTHGHAAGDQILRAVAHTLTSRLRASDAVARLGGDEFAVLLHQTNPAQANTVANELIAAIADITINTPTGTAQTSASIGITRVDGDDANPSELLARADDAMYRAKRSGGNQALDANNNSLISASAA